MISIEDANVLSRSTSTHRHEKKRARARASRKEKKARARYGGLAPSPSSSDMSDISDSSSSSSSSSGSDGSDDSSGSDDEDVADDEDVRSSSSSDDEEMTTKNKSSTKAAADESDSDDAPKSATVAPVRAADTADPDVATGPMIRSHTEESDIVARADLEVDPEEERQRAAAAAATEADRVAAEAASEVVRARRKVALLDGQYKMILALVRVLPDGHFLKNQVDRVIDHCDAMQNLRTSIYELKVKVHTALESKRAFFVRRGRTYIERYFFLICFNAYFRDEAERSFAKSFVSWYRERPELSNILMRYRDRFPDER